MVRIADTCTRGSSQASAQLLDTLNSSKLQYLKLYELTCRTAGGLSYCCLLRSVFPKSKKNQLMINKSESNSHSSWNGWVMCHPWWCTYCLLESDHVHHQQLQSANQCWLYSVFHWGCTWICFPSICIAQHSPAPYSSVRQPFNIAYLFWGLQCESKDWKLVRINIYFHITFLNCEKHNTLFTCTHKLL